MKYSMVSPVSRITGIFVQPKKTFEDAKDDPLIFVVSLYGAIVFLSFLVNLAMPALAPSAGPSIAAFFLLGSAFSLLYSLFGALIGAGLLAIVTRIAGQKQTLRPAARIFLYSNIPMALANLIITAISALLMLLSPFAAFGIYSVSWILSIVMFIWTIVLIIIGVKAVFGFSTLRAAACGIAAVLAMGIVAFGYPFPSILSLSAGALAFGLLAVPVIAAAVFGFYYLLEYRQMVQEERGGWEKTQIYSFAAIAVLLISFFYLPIYQHGRYTDMSQLATALQSLMGPSARTASTMGMQQVEMIAIIGLMNAIFFLHGIGVVKRKIPILSTVLSFVFLAISFSYIAGWQSFYSFMDSHPVQPGWGTWIVPLVGLGYLLLVLWYKEPAPPRDGTQQG
jgi:hypothetical protein